MLVGVDFGRLSRWFRFYFSFGPRARGGFVYFSFARAFGVGFGRCGGFVCVLVLGLVLVAVVSFICGAFWVWCCFRARVKLVLCVIQRPLFFK